MIELSVCARMHASARLRVRCAAEEGNEERGRRGGGEACCERVEIMI